MGQEIRYPFLLPIRDNRNVLLDQVQTSRGISWQFESSPVNLQYDYFGAFHDSSWHFLNLVAWAALQFTSKIEWWLKTILFLIFQRVYCSLNTWKSADQHYFKVCIITTMPLEMLPISLDFTYCFSFISITLTLETFGTFHS